MWGKSPAAQSMPSSRSEAVGKPRTEDLGIRQFTGSAMRSILADVRAAFGPGAIILKQESGNGRIRITACSEGQLSKLVSGRDAFGHGLSATDSSGAGTPGPDATARSRIRSGAFDDDVFGIGPVRETRVRSSDPAQSSQPRPPRRVADVELPADETTGRSWWSRAKATTFQGHAGTTHSGTTHSGTTHSGTTHAGTTHAGTTHAGTTHAVTTDADAQLLADLNYSESVVPQLVGETDGAGLAERIARQLVEPGGPITADPDTGTLLPGAYRFSGPAGHGKTSLISRLATAFVLAHGTDGVVLLSTDQDRLGGTLKLARLSQLLGVDFHVTEETDIPLWCRQGHRLLLIDTDGEPSTAKRTRNSPTDVLVLSAVAQNRLLARALDSASPDCVIALIQLDQAETLGSTFSVLLGDDHLRRPIEWLGFGQSIDDSHSAASIANVSQWALRGVDRSGKRTNFS